MDRGALPTLADSIAAAQGWWREAGVDLAFTDDPRAWLPPEVSATEAMPSAAVAATLPPERIRPTLGGNPVDWPQTVTSFQSWWLAEPSLDTGGMHARVAPRGNAGAELMVLVPMPEAEDQDRLLSAIQGKLIANMLRAMGISEATAYLASALPRRAAMPDWNALVVDGLGEVLRHHVALVAPKRLLVLGRDILPLLAHDWAQDAPPPAEMAIASGNVPMLASYAPARLLDHARLRADLWRRWLKWTDGNTP